MAFKRKLFERLQVAYNVVVLTGAGMSAPSGVPTFRGKDGLWNKYNPRDLANEAAFRSQPDLVWEWYSWRRELINGISPNAGHRALAELETLYPECSVITQNVDGLHQAAGTKKIIELHGNIRRSKCIDCNKVYDQAGLKLLQPQAGQKVLRCSQCQGMVRPDVVWFGEMLPEQAISSAQKLASEAEVFFSIGTSSTVEPAASLPYLAKGNGAYLVEINPEETPLSGVADDKVSTDVAEVLPKLVAVIKKIRSASR